MYKPSFRSWVDRNWFALFTFLFVAVVLIGVYLLKILVEEQEMAFLSINTHLAPASKVFKPNKKPVTLGFSFKCFDDKLRIHCEDKKFCKKDFERSLRIICHILYKAGASCLKKSDVYIKSFKVWNDVTGTPTCKEPYKSSTGCLSHFSSSMHNFNGYQQSYIYLRSDIVSADKDSRDPLLAHEISHALINGYVFSTRIVSEFLAVYSQLEMVSAKRYYYVCNGEKWNQSALSTEEGCYKFPPDPKNKPMVLLSACRYGQLEHLVRQLRAVSPFLYIGLWKKLEGNRYAKVDIEKLKDWIREIDKRAWRVARRNYLLKKSNNKPNIVWVNYGNNYYFFPYQYNSCEDENYFPDARPRLRVYGRPHLLEDSKEKKHNYINTVIRYLVKEDRMDIDIKLKDIVLKKSFVN